MLAEPRWPIPSPASPTRTSRERPCEPLSAAQPASASPTRIRASTTAFAGNYIFDSPARPQSGRGFCPMFVRIGRISAGSRTTPLLGAPATFATRATPTDDVVQVVFPKQFRLSEMCGFKGFRKWIGQRVLLIDDIRGVQFNTGPFFSAPEYIWTFLIQQVRLT
jgi:hypothetical protein